VPGTQVSFAKAAEDRVDDGKSGDRDGLIKVGLLLELELLESGSEFGRVFIETLFPAIHQHVHLLQLIFVSPNATALRALMEHDSAGIAIVEVFHPNACTMGAVQFIVIILFGGKDLFVNTVQGSDLFRGENGVVVLGERLELARVQPFASAARTGVDLHTIGLNRGKGGTAPWAFHVRDGNGHASISARGTVRGRAEYGWFGFNAKTAKNAKENKNRVAIVG